MSINHMIWQNLKKNIRSYYLYVFALVFSVALYFSFVTLQYDPALEEKSNTVKGSAGIFTGSVLLIVIVAIFLLYANTLFIKRRSREIGLFQLIGMTKGKVFRILSVENIMLYIGSLVIGVFIGFAGSKLIKMIFFKVTGINHVAALHFSEKALFQTILVFFVIYLFIMLMNYLYIRSQSVLSLFQARSSSENNIKRLSFVQVVIGNLGIGLIALGYYLSTLLFGGDGLNSAAGLMVLMISILGSVIVGTYLFFKGSVSFILQLIRKSKAGYLSIHDVMSLSSIMFRMKTNALVLTIITVVAALAIGLLSLSYISYYSADKSAQEMAPDHFTIPNQKQADEFSHKLKAQHIDNTIKQIKFVNVDADLSQAVDKAPTDSGFDLKNNHIVITSDRYVKGANLSKNEAMLTGGSSSNASLISFKDKGKLTLSSKKDDIDVHYTEKHEKNIITTLISFLPTVVVNDETYQEIAKNKNPDLQSSFANPYIGINLKDDTQLDKAATLFKQMGFADKDEPGYYAQTIVANDQMKATGLTMFIVGFLGLTFLVTSGCILYFKQMDEGEEEKSTYTILRKLGFTEKDLMRGIWYKQLFNFGIPLILGLLHSYFAVKSGWFIFGTEMLTPTLIVMSIYTILYSIFGFLSVLYYKRIIRESL